jgi:kinesin family protein 3/17
MTGVSDNPELRGVIPNSFQHIFEAIISADSSKTYLVCCSYCEIYNEEFRDLLNPKNPDKLELRENSENSVHIPNLTKSIVKSVTDIDKLMTSGSKQRVTKETAMNSRSSRSHAIFTIYVELSEE